MVVEAIGGLIAGSLALIADAGHMLLDVVALAMTYLGFRLSARPADRKRSFGYQRLQTLAAFANGITLLVFVVWIAIEAVGRLFAPTPVDGVLLIVIATLGLIVNAAAFFVLSGGETGNLNMRGALAHVLSDLLGSGAAVISGVVILWSGWLPIDAVLSIIVAGLVARAAWSVVRGSGHILLEGTPEALDVDELGLGVVKAVPGIHAVHHVHVWSLTASYRLATLHVVISPGTDPGKIIQQVNAYLDKAWEIGHATIQVEHETCERTPQTTLEAAATQPDG